MKKIYACALSGLMLATLLPSVSLAANLGGTTTTTYFDFDCSTLPALNYNDSSKASIVDGALSMAAGERTYYEMGVSRGDRKGLDSGVISFEFDTKQTDWRNDPIFEVYYLYDVEAGWSYNSSVKLYTAGGNGNMYWQYTDADGATQNVDSGFSWSNTTHATVKVDVDNNTAVCVLAEPGGYTTTRTLNLNDVQYVYRADFCATTYAATFDNMKCYKTVETPADADLIPYFNFDCSTLPNLKYNDATKVSIVDGKLSMTAGARTYYEMGESRADRKGLDSGVVYFEFDTTQTDWRNDPIFEVYYLYDIEGGWSCNNSIALYTAGGNGNMYWRYTDADNTTQTVDTGYSWNNITHATIAVDVDNNTAVCTLAEPGGYAPTRTLNLNDVQYVYRADFCATTYAATFDNLQCYKKATPAAPTYDLVDYGVINKNEEAAGAFYNVKVSEVNDTLTLGVEGKEFTINNLGSFNVATALTYAILGYTTPSTDITVKSGATVYEAE